MAFAFHGENEYSIERAARERCECEDRQAAGNRRRVPNRCFSNAMTGSASGCKQVARYVLDEPNELALETLAVIAERCGVQPSAIVRFAQSFGFSGASQMQRLFRDGLLSANAAIGYGERVRRFSESVSKTAAGDGLLSEFVDGNVLALQNLSETVSEQEMRAAVDLIAKAAVVHVAGFRRAFPISAYLAYSLQQLGKHVQFIDGVGGLARPQANTIDRKDLLIAVSFHPYAPETVELVEIAARNGRQDPVDQRQPGEPDRKAGRYRSSGARFRGPELSLARRLHVPGPGRRHRLRIRDRGQAHSRRKK